MKVACVDIYFKALYFLVLPLFKNDFTCRDKFIIENGLQFVFGQVVQIACE